MQLRGVDPPGELGQFRGVQVAEALRLAGRAPAPCRRTVSCSAAWLSAEPPKTSDWCPRVTRTWSSAESRQRPITAARIRRGRAGDCCVMVISEWAFREGLSRGQARRDRPLPVILVARARHAILIGISLDRRIALRPRNPAQCGTRPVSVLRSAQAFLRDVACHPVGHPDGDAAALDLVLAEEPPLARGKPRQGDGQRHQVQELSVFLLQVGRGLLARARVVSSIWNRPGRNAGGCFSRIPAPGLGRVIHGSPRPRSGRRRFPVVLLKLSRRRWSSQAVSPRSWADRIAPGGRSTGPRNAHSAFPWTVFETSPPGGTETLRRITFDDGVETDKMNPVKKKHDHSPQAGTTLQVRPSPTAR